MSRSTEPPQAHTRITSFGFLPEETTSQDGSFGLGSLLSKVKTVFTSSTDQPVATSHDSLATASIRTKSPEPREVAQAQAALSAAQTTVVAPPVGGSLAPSPLIIPETKQPFRGGKTQPPTKGLPKTLRAIAPATAVISTVPAHVSGQIADDARSLAGSPLEEDTLGPLAMRRSDLVEAYLPISSIPGFPLSSDLLADDAQSVHSSSSRRDSYTGHQPYKVPSSSSLQTSAEAFRRLTLKGGAAQSKEWWMPDASAKECSGCGSAFTMTRRKHHCRCCGQIFDSQCCSHLLDGSKVGLEGIVRVCDFCAQMIKEYDRARAGTGHQGHKTGWTTDGRVRADMISAPVEAAVKNVPQSRFAANTLFGATALGQDTGRRPSYAGLHSIEASGERSPDSRPSTPNTSLPTFLLSPDEEDHHDAQAPFRRGLGDEDHVVDNEPTTEDISEPAAENVPSSPLDESGGYSATQVSRKPLSASSIAFPTREASPSKAVARNALDEARARLASDASLNHESRARLVSDAAIKAFRRSRLRSRVNLDDLTEKSSSPLGGVREDLADSRPGSRSGGIQELEPASLMHLRRLMAQLLNTSQIQEKEKWMEILLPLILKVIGDVRPQAMSKGKSMGVRRLVKIKRIPGGHLQDSHLINGYICSHNVASKAMIRKMPLKNARVALLSFPLTAVKGEGQYVSLDALSASEREYTRILVARVLSLRSHLVVVKDQVSRMALEMLEQAGVVVVWKVPESSMAAIARVTQSDIVTSIDRLALQPRLGRCGTFVVDTYHSVLLPGKRRSFLRFTGTARELGCSVILRGGGQILLGKIKCILELCLLAAHNLRLEESMRDATLALLPEPPRSRSLLSTQDNGDKQQDSDDEATCLPFEDAKVVSALDKYRSTLLSISTTIRAPPPYPLVRLHQERQDLSKLESQMTARDEDAEVDKLDDLQPEKTSSEDVSSADELSEKVNETHQPEDQIVTLDQQDDVEPQVQAVLPSEEAMTLRTKCALTRSRCALYSRRIAATIHDSDTLSPFSHQRLIVLHSCISSATLKPCVGPQIEVIEYYGRDDETLGSWLDTKSAAASQLCKAKACGLQQILHYDSYIHNEVRVQCFCERFVCPIGGQENSILTWEYCKMCESATPVSVVNEDAMGFSWAKWLEAHFYTLQTTSASCSHERLVDRIRYFAYKNLAFRIHVEQLQPLDVAVPGLRLVMRPDLQSKVKAEESLGLARRADAYFHSVAARLKALEHEISVGRDGAAALERHHPLLDIIRDTAVEGRREVNRLLASRVKASEPGDTLCLNEVRRRLQDIVVRVDQRFASAEKVALPKERDVRRLTTNHLSRLFNEKETLERGGSGIGGALDNIGSTSTAGNDNAGNEGMPSNQSEGSIAALARVADTAALGLPHLLGLSFEDTSARATPTSEMSRPTSSMLSSTRNSAQSSQTATPTRERSESVTFSASSPDTDIKSKLAFAPISVKAKKVDEAATKSSTAVEESDGNSSPTTQLKPLIRPKPRRPKAPRRSDSSCNDGGEVTDGQHVSALVHQFDQSRPASRNQSKVNAKKAAGPSTKEQVTSDPDTRPNSRASVRSRITALSRVTSPVQLDSGPQGTAPQGPIRARSHPVVPTRTTASGSAAPRSRGERSGPPSSYRAPVSSNRQGRASESESDVGLGSSRSGEGHGTKRLRGSNTLRPPLSRRTSNKSDSGNESRSRSGPGTIRRATSSQSGIPVPRTPRRSAAIIPTAATRGRVSTIARQFDRLNREAEREREKAKRALALRARRALPIAVSSARIAEYTSVSAAVESDESSSDEDDDDGEEDNDEDNSQPDEGDEADSEDEAEGVQMPKPGQPSSTETQATTDHPALPTKIDPLLGSSAEPGEAKSPEKAVERLMPALNAHQQTSLSTAASSIEPSALEKGSLLKTISSFWASRTGVTLPLLEYPLSAEQHLFADSPLLLREDEPSSTIAFTLVSNKYQERMRMLRAARATSSTPQHNDESDPSFASLANGAGKEIEASLRQPEGVHLRFDFESGASRFHCRILFSEQFDALRRCCGCEQSLISSLARCVKWDSTGGKSGMTFLKTRDDRLVLKQLSSSEMASFSSFAPHYFAHMTDCLMHGKPTTLAKIFGLYRISMRNQATGRSYKLDILVMENLFYGRQCSRIFDLKGSMRNRYLKETGAPGEVLLDENLVEISLQKPLFIREGGKAMLRQALKHDATMLAERNVMDYSVVVGVDTSGNVERPCLVVGIIDFLRTYTFEKRVETFVKEQSSLLGAAKNELPTVITPKQYANRFLTFMDSILLVSPDAWFQPEDTHGGVLAFASAGTTTSGGAHG